MDKVSVIIPTYNRYKYLLNAVDSVLNQTYKNIELIVINDCSTQPDYEKGLENFTVLDIKNKSINQKNPNLILINLEKNSKTRLGYGCAAFVRNMGIKIASGDYISFLDDDDYWLPTKIEEQIKIMKEKGINMCCTDCYIGKGPYNSKVKYGALNNEICYNTILSKYWRNGWDIKTYPEIWDNDFLNIHNCIICSSVIVHKNIIKKIGEMKLINRAEDYDYWKRCLNYTKCIYINKPLLFYDNGHGDGRNY